VTNNCGSLDLLEGILLPTKSSRDLEINKTPDELPYRSKMAYIRLIKYPGAKFAIIPDIIKTVSNSGCNQFVDVFGGSGSVSLNINYPSTIYNDLDPQFANVFKAIKYHPGKLYEMLKYAVSNQNVSNEGRLEKISSGMAKKLGRDGHTIKRPFYANDYDLSRAGLSTQHDSLKNSDGAPEWARDTIIRFSRTFGGMGETYATTNEKSTDLFLRKTINSFGKIHDVVRLWEIENMDFREIIAKYDSENTFFYFDPPYPGKNWYSYSFANEDFLELAKYLKDLKGKYLLNLNADDIPLGSIFGRPTFIKKYRNQNVKGANTAGGIRSKSFYTNF